MTVAHASPIRTGTDIGRMVTDGQVVSEEAVRWAARQVVRMHTEPASGERRSGSCAKCREGGCPLLTWARVAVEPGHAL
jgi:hypothetical protein